MLDPKTLTPESLYRLQSETWVQGAEYERKRIVGLLGDAQMELAQHADLANDQKDAEMFLYYSMKIQYLNKLVALIKREQS